MLLGPSWENLVNKLADKLIFFLFALTRSMQVGLDGFLKEVLSLTMSLKLRSKKRDSKQGSLSSALKSLTKTMLLYVV